MTQISRRRIRLKLDYAKKTSERFTDVRTDGTPELWVGNDVQFEIGFFFAAAIIDDITNITSLTLNVRKDNASGALLMTKTITGAELTSCISEAWENGSGQHALVTFAGAEANVAEGSHWLAVAIVTTDDPGRSVTIGTTNIKLVQDGIGSEAAAQAVDGLAYTKPEADARYVQKHEDQAWAQWLNGRWYHYIASTDLWYPEIATLKDGVPVLTLGEGVAL